LQYLFRSVREAHRTNRDSIPAHTYHGYKRIVVEEEVAEETTASNEEE